MSEDSESPPSRILGAAVGGLIVLTNGRTLVNTIGLEGNPQIAAYVALIAIWCARHRRGRARYPPGATSDRGRRGLTTTTRSARPLPVRTRCSSWRTMHPMSAKLRIATFLAPNMPPVYEFVVDAIGRELGSGAELVVGASFDQFGNGEIDAGFICGLPYVQLTRQTPPRSSCWRRR